MRDTTTGSPPMIGRALSIAAWQAYVASYDFGSLPPNKLVLHHTWNPTVASWRGLRSMQAMQRYYNGKNWRSAPHIYIGPEADQNIWLFTPLREVGIHASSGNANLEYQKSWKFEDLQWYSIGVELVGNYDKVKPSGFVLAGMRAVLGGLSKRLGDAVGLDWFLALAQMAHETGNLTSFWSQRPQRNPAGLGVDGRWQASQPTDAMPVGWAYNSQRSRWEAGLSFRSWVSESIPAHLGRLLAYALQDDEANPVQWALIDQALRWRSLPSQYRGSAKTIQDLDGRWAVPGVGYGERIVVKRDAIALVVSNR